MWGGTVQRTVPPHTRQGFALPPSPKERVFFFSKKGLHFWKTYDTIPRVPGQNIGMSPSGKAPDFDSGIRRFKSGHPSQHDPLAQLAEQLPFKQWVRGSNPRRVTSGATTNVVAFLLPPLGLYPPGGLLNSLRKG